MPMAAAVATPFDDAAGRTYFNAYREIMLPTETYYYMVLVAGWSPGEWLLRIKR